MMSMSNSRPWPIPAHIAWAVFCLSICTALTMLGRPELTYALLASLIPYVIGNWRLILLGSPLHIGADLLLTRSEKREQWHSHNERKALAIGWVYHGMMGTRSFSQHPNTDSRRQACEYCPEQAPKADPARHLGNCTCIECHKASANGWDRTLSANDQYRAAIAESKAKIEAAMTLALYQQGGVVGPRVMVEGVSKPLFKEPYVTVWRHPLEDPHLCTSCTWTEECGSGQSRWHMTTPCGMHAEQYLPSTYSPTTQWATITEDGTREVALNDGDNFTPECDDCEWDTIEDGAGNPVKAVRTYTCIDHDPTTKPTPRPFWSLP